MAAYLVIEDRIIDEAAFAEYASKIAGVVEANGGKFLARGGKIELVRGDRTPQRLVIVEFESFEKAQAHFASPRYTELAELRDKATARTTLIVDGL